MDWVPAIATFFLGLTSAVGLEWAKATIQRRQARADRKEDFQRQTLIDLQDAMRASIDRLADTALGPSADENREAFDTNFAQYNEQFYRMLVLYPRVQNQAIRKEAEQFMSLIIEMVMVMEQMIPADFFGRLNLAFKSLSESIGAELRRL